MSHSTASGPQAGWHPCEQSKQYTAASQTNHVLRVTNFSACQECQSFPEPLGNITLSYPSLCLQPGSTDHCSPIAIAKDPGSGCCELLGCFGSASLADCIATSSNQSHIALGSAKTKGVSQQDLGHILVCFTEQPPHHSQQHLVIPSDSALVLMVVSATQPSALHVAASQCQASLQSNCIATHC